MAGQVEFREVDISQDFATADKYGIQAVPTEVIIDKNGNVVDKFVGPRDKAVLQSSLEEALSN